MECQYITFLLDNFLWSSIKSEIFWKWFFWCVKSVFQCVFLMCNWWRFIKWYRRRLFEEKDKQPGRKKNVDTSNQQKLVNDEVSWKYLIYENGNEHKNYNLWYRSWWKRRSVRQAFREIGCLRRIVWKYACQLCNY